MQVIHLFLLFFVGVAYGFAIGEGGLHKATKKSTSATPNVVTFTTTTPNVGTSTTTTPNVVTLTTTTPNVVSSTTTTPNVGTSTTTTPNVVSSTTTTPKVISPTTPSVPVEECGCTYNKIWLDIILVADSSSAMTKYGLETLTNYFLSVVTKMTVGQEQSQVSRIGAIIYGENAGAVYNLTAFKSVEDMYEKFNLPYYGTFGSNIEAAIRLATHEFEGPNHRSNAKKVIIIAASHFEPGTSTDPIQVAETFKGNGGVIITLEYVQTHGLDVPILKELATSPCYQLTNRYGKLKVDDLLDVMCKANCFCKTQWFSYMNETQCQTPQGGCFFPVAISSNEFLAKRFCQKEVIAMLPKIPDIGKAVFLASLTSHHQRTWLGLKWNGTVYKWNDGTVLGSFRPLVHANHTKPCVFQKYISDTKVEWHSAGCSDEDFVYSCQTKPCNTDFFCFENADSP